MKSFFSDQAKTTVKNAIITAESTTSAEVVVTVKPRSSHYREFDYVVGAFFALAMLCALMFHPAELDENWFPVAVIVSFLLGTVVSATFWPLKRALIRNHRLDEEVARAARDVFVRMGIHGTSGRTGMLVYVSAFEKRAEVVLDLGLDPSKLGDGFTTARTRILNTASQGNVELFAQAVADLGKALEGVLPRSADDVNELPDEVS